MKKKLKQMMNKEEGFTLVELLAVIVILGIIVAIAIPAVGSVMDRASDDADDAEISLVEDAARLYVTTEREELEDRWGTEGNGSTLTVDVDDLYSKGYLEDRGDEAPLSGEVIVERDPVEGEGEGYTYKYNAEDVSTASSAE